MSLSEHRSCTFPGCTRPHLAKGLCGGHYYQRRRGGPLSPLKPLEAARTCETPGCDEPHKARGLCEGCYGRQRREANQAPAKAPHPGRKFARGIPYNPDPFAPWRRLCAAVIMSAVAEARKGNQEEIEWLQGDMNPFAEALDLHEDIPADAYQPEPHDPPRLDVN